MDVFQMYSCNPPCLPQGCPGHIATLTYHPETNRVTFLNGRTTIVELNHADLKVLCRLLFRIEGVDFAGFVRDAREDLTGEADA